MGRLFFDIEMRSLRAAPGDTEGRFMALAPCAHTLLRITCCGTKEIETLSLVELLECMLLFSLEPGLGREERVNGSGALVEPLESP